MDCAENASLLHPYTLAPFLLPHSQKKCLGGSDSLLPQGVFILRLLVDVNLISVTQECKKDTALWQKRQVFFISLADDAEW